MIYRTSTYFPMVFDDKDFPCNVNGFTRIGTMLVDGAKKTEEEIYSP